MISQFKRCAAVIFVAAFLQVPRPAAGKPNEAAPPTPQELQAQLQQQQERIQRLEALVRQQNEILGNLSRQLTDHQQGNSASPTGSTPATPTGNEAAPMSEIDRITGELDAVAENNKELHTKVATLEKNLDSATSAGVAGWDSTIRSFAAGTET